MTILKLLLVYSLLATVCQSFPSKRRDKWTRQNEILSDPFRENEDGQWFGVDIINTNENNDKKESQFSKIFNQFKIVTDDIPQFNFWGNDDNWSLFKAPKPLNNNKKPSSSHSFFNEPLWSSNFFDFENNWKKMQKEKLKWKKFRKTINNDNGKGWQNVFIWNYDSTKDNESKLNPNQMFKGSGVFKLFKFQQNDKDKSSDDSEKNTSDAWADLDFEDNWSENDLTFDNFNTQWKENDGDFFMSNTETNDINKQSTKPSENDLTLDKFNTQSKENDGDFFMSSTETNDINKQSTKPSNITIEESDENKKWDDNDSFTDWKDLGETDWSPLSKDFWGKEDDFGESESWYAGDDNIWNEEEAHKEMLSTDWNDEDFNN